MQTTILPQQQSLFSSQTCFFIRPRQPPLELKSIRFKDSVSHLVTPVILCHLVGKLRGELVVSIIVIRRKGKQVRSAASKGLLTIEDLLQICYSKLLKKGSSISTFRRILQVTEVVHIKRKAGSAISAGRLKLSLRRGLLL